MRKRQKCHDHDKWSKSAIVELVRDNESACDVWKWSNKNWKCVEADYQFADVDAYEMHKNWTNHNNSSKHYHS